MRSTTKPSNHQITKSPNASYFATDLRRAEEGASESGGSLKRLVFDGDRARAVLVGLPNPIDAREDLQLPLAIYRNRTGKTATIDIGDSSVHLQEGEWRTTNRPTAP